MEDYLTQYHCGHNDSDMKKRITTIPVGFSIVMLEGRMYNYGILREVM